MAVENKLANKKITKAKLKTHNKRVPREQRISSSEFFGLVRTTSDFNWSPREGISVYTLDDGQIRAMLTSKDREVMFTVGYSTLWKFLTGMERM